MKKQLYKMIENEIPVPQSDVVAIDVEVFGQIQGKLHRPTGTFASIQICDGKTVWIITNEDMVKDAVKSVMHCKYLIMHNAMYDMRQLRRWTTALDEPKVGIIWDTMLIEKAAYGGYYSDFSLKDLTRRYFEAAMDKTEREQFGLIDVMTDEMKEYACLDAYYTYKIYEEQTELNVPAYWKFDEPNIWVMLDIKPVKIDVKAWATAAAEFEVMGRAIEAELGQNVRSYAKLKEWLSAKLKVKIDNTSADVLESLFDPIADKILLARTYLTAKSTYGLGWLEKNVEDEYVWSNWSISGAATGRFSSSDPNLQNIPSTKIPLFRTFFIQSKGCMTIADISQQEPRILAALSGDKALNEIFATGQDVHTAVGAMAFNKPGMTKDDPLRKISKAINLGTSYGLTAVGLSAKLHIDEKEAQTFLDAYFMKFGGVRMYIEKYRGMAKKVGYITTMGGRKVYVNPYTQSAENNAINAPIQGSAADFTKLWQYKMYQRFKADKVPLCFVMPIHDELVFDHPVEQTQYISSALNSTLEETAAELVPGIPFKCDIAHGANWGAKV